MVSKEVTTTSVDSMDGLYVVFENITQLGRITRTQKQVPAVFNNSKLTCVAPHVTKKGPVEFSISLDGMHYSVGGGCDSTFTYVEKESVNSEDIVITPGSSSVAGGDLVTVSGLDILALGGRGGGGSVRCRFGNIEMRALVDAGTNELKCLTPKVSELGETKFAVSFNGGVDYVDLDSYVFWRDPTRALGLNKQKHFVLWPRSMIATSNNTGKKSVTVLGHLSALPSSSTNVFDCHFGDQVTKGRTISEAAGGVLKCDERSIVD